VRETCRDASSDTRAAQAGRTISESEYVQLDAMALAALVRRRELSASELLEVAIARAERLNPRLNAIVIPMYELARERARSPLGGPLAGVPFLLKDLYQDYAGVLATSGSRALRRARATPTRHSEIVERDLAAGLVVFGKTNTPEFGAKGITEPEAWGPTRNPWNLAIRLAARAEARRPRSPPASFRWQARATAADRSAFRQRRPACSG